MTDPTNLLADVAVPDAAPASAETVVAPLRRAAQIRPGRGYALVREEAAPTKTGGGLILPQGMARETFSGFYFEATVVSYGPPELIPRLRASAAEKLARLREIPPPPQDQRGASGEIVRRGDESLYEWIPGAEPDKDFAPGARVLCLAGYGSEIELAEGQHRIVSQRGILALVREGHVHCWHLQGGVPVARCCSCEAVVEDFPSKLSTCGPHHGDWPRVLVDDPLAKPQSHFPPPVKSLQTHASVETVPVDEAGRGWQGLYENPEDAARL